MFQFWCRFVFINFSSFKSNTENNANFDTVSSKRGKGKILIKSLEEYKGHNAWQFITEFPNKGWTKNNINRLLVKFGTVDRRLGSGRPRAHTDKNVDTVESLLLSQKDKPQSHRTVREISREAGGSVDHQFRRLFRKICASSATRKGALNSWLGFPTRVLDACKPGFFGFEFCLALCKATNEAAVYSVSQKNPP